jgi:hypothetical protein
MSSITDMRPFLVTDHALEAPMFEPLDKAANPADRSTGSTHAPDGNLGSSAGPNSRWFSVEYTQQSSLPPAFQASRVCSYTDAEDTWVIALWDNSDPQVPSNCILRVRSSEVTGVREHATMTDALRAAYGQ